MKFYRGAAHAARAYLEQDRSRADEYYLAEGSGVATLLSADPNHVETVAVIDGDDYERWVAGIDLATGRPKGHLREDADGLRFLEVTVNGPKTWSLAAALYPEVSAALDEAQASAARQIVGWLTAHSTTRVGPRGRQVQVPVERIEATVMRHYTSRSGDPHRHLHLQINARVFAEGAWRGIHSVGVRDSIEAINGIGHAAVITDPGFRAALANAGLSLDFSTGELRELEPYAGRFSARASQIGANIDRYEVEWRRAHPGETPGPHLREVWDRRAWAEARPDKVVPANGADPALDSAQARTVAALAGTAAVLVVEGAAGAGKTTTLATTRQLLAARRRRLLIVTPTLKAAEVAAREVGTEGHSAAWLIKEHGWSWDADGHWLRRPRTPAPAAQLRRGDLLLVDEAGMLDQDTARALLTLADETGARITFMGDRHQLPAVGRGGVLDLAITWTHVDAVLDLDTVHRFADPDYAALTLDMRTGHSPDQAFDQLLTRGQIVLHPSDVERTAALAGLASAGALVVADSRDQVAALNAAARERQHPEASDSEWTVATDRGEKIGLGDRIATRLNDPDLGVANRQTWTVAGIGEDGGLLLAGSNTSRRRTVPADYVAKHVELAYATTAYGAQGETVDHAHAVIGETTGAASAYVAITRGRHTNTAHLVADSPNDAKKQWTTVFSRDRADLGPTHARQRAIDDIDRYGPSPRRRGVRSDPTSLPGAQPPRPGAPAPAGLQI